MLVEFLYKELKHTPKSAYNVLLAEIVLIILIIKYHWLKKQYIQQVLLIQIKHK